MYQIRRKFYTARIFKVKFLFALIFFMAMDSCSPIKTCFPGKHKEQEYKQLYENEKLRVQTINSIFSDSLRVLQMENNYSEIALKQKVIELYNTIVKTYSIDTDGDEVYDFIDTCPKEKGCVLNKGCF